jgi:hypothetical protein
MLKAPGAEEWILSTKLEKQVRRLLMSPAGRAALKAYGVDVEIVKEEEAIKGQPRGLHLVIDRRERAQGHSKRRNSPPSC